jgi:hypothetical protein
MALKGQKINRYANACLNAPLADEFTRQNRSGDTVYGFVAGLFPTNKPVLPDQEAETRHD